MSVACVSTRDHVHAATEGREWVSGPDTVGV